MLVIGQIRPKSRGRLVLGTDVFEGSFKELEEFVPDKITKRHVFSKYGALWDITGKFTPITASMKLLLRKTVSETTGWDDSLSMELRSKWIKEFWRIQKMKGVRFNRARMPVDAVDANLRLIAAADAANDLKVVGVWAGFRRKCGTFSCQLLIGRSILAREDYHP